MLKGVIFKAVSVAVVFLGLLTVLFGSWYTVDEGERGVLLRNGAVIGTVEPGLHFKTPIIEDVEYLSVQTKAQVYEGMWAYSRDQQPAMLSVSVNYRLDPGAVGTTYATYHNESGVLSRLVDRVVNQQIKTVFGQFTAVSAIQERARLNVEVKDAVQQAVIGPVIIEGVQIENIDFSDAYEKSVEDRMLAEVEVERLRQNAEREKVQAEIVVTRARAKADAVRQQAMAEAEATKLRGDAEATAIRARGEALKDNPALIELVQAERWNGTLPTTMVPGGAVPFMNVAGR